MATRSSFISKRSRSNRRCISYRSTQLSSNRLKIKSNISNPSTDKQAALLSNAWKLRAQAKQAEEKRKKNRWSVSINTPSDRSGQSLMRSSLQTSELASILSSLWKECKTSRKSRCSGFIPRSIAARSSRGTVRSISLHTLSKAKNRTQPKEPDSNHLYVRDIVFSREGGNKSHNGHKACKIVLREEEKNKKSLRGFIANNNNVLSSLARFRPSLKKEEVDPRRRTTADTMETSV